MSRGTCSLCFSVTRVLDIKYTHLQNVYQEISDDAIQADSHPLCYICCAKLHQCERMLRQIQENNSVRQLDRTPLVCLGMFNTDNWSLQNNDLETKLQPIIKEECIEQDTFLEDTNDYEVKKELSIESEAGLAGITQELSNVDNIDALQKAKIPKLIIVKLSQSVIDKYVRQSSTTHAVTEIYPENRGEKTFVEPSTQYREIKEEIKDKGIEPDDEQGNTNDCEGRDRAGEAQSGRYRGPLSCDVCLKNFASKSKLIEHMRTHTGERPFSCNICFKKFSQNYVLKRHQITHRSEKPFSCDICLKKFSAKRNLDNHTLIHTGEKPFSCDICLKKFSIKRNLNKHKIIHTAEKPFSCDICSKKFYRSSDLKIHQRTHTNEKPFSCDICSKKFSRSSYLKIHQIIHTNEKPFSCDICSKKFTQKIQLNNHIFNHTGEKPFSCDICLKKFSIKRNLNNHILIHKRHKTI